MHSSNYSCIRDDFCALFISLYLLALFFTDRLSDFIMTVSNVSFPVTSYELVSPAFTWCGQYQGYPGPGQRGTVTCSPGPSRGRYVFISLPTLGILTMCETQVFAGRAKTKFKFIGTVCSLISQLSANIYESSFCNEFILKKLIITFHPELRFDSCSKWFEENAGLTTCQAHVGWKLLPW